MMSGIAISCLPVRKKNRLSPYLVDERLADVLALIQVLALDECAHRSEEGLTSELQGPPRSAEHWSEVAEDHPEFFRVAPTGEHRTSLVARHVIPRKDKDSTPLAPEYTSKLLELAIELHDRQIRRSQNWHVWVPMIVAITAGTFTLFGICLEGIFGGR